MRSEPDGYTILMGHVGTHAVAVSLYPNLAYKPDVDFEPIGLVSEFPMLIVARKDFPPKDLKEFVPYVKENHAKLNVGHAGVGSVFYITNLLLDSILKVRPTMVPFNGGLPAMNALLSGQVDYLCADATTAAPQLEGGKIKAYAIASPQRNPILPNVPTTVEAGLPEFQTSAWFALFAPKATPQADPRPAVGRARQGARRRQHRQAHAGARQRDPGEAAARPAGVAGAGQERDRALDAGHQGRGREGGVGAAAARNCVARREWLQSWAPALPLPRYVVRWPGKPAQAPKKSAL